MTDQQTFITADGLEKLKAELDVLKNVKRKEIAERIQEAKELGDLSENAEYSEAKDEQSFIESRILELESTLRNISVIAKIKKTGAVQIGSTFEVKNEQDKASTYTLVGKSEADPNTGKISNESPLGQAFLGKKEGETVAVAVPAGTINFTITKVR
ncbi:MAG: transcription elongation factor GreA [Patescibacteria group bacterium]